MPEIFTPLPEQNICHDPDHNPANFLVRKRGHYKHICPSCGKIEEFDVEPHTF